MKIIALLLALLASSAKAVDIRTVSNPPGQRYLTATSTTGAYTAESFTATSYSSAPVVYVSSVQAASQKTPGIDQEDILFYDASGNIILNLDGGSSSGLRINQKRSNSSLGSRVYNLEIFGSNDNSTPDAAFRSKDTTIIANQNLGNWAWRDSDSSTGGSGEKAVFGAWSGQSDWSTGTSFESEFRWGMNRENPNAFNYHLIVNSTHTITRGLVVSGQNSAALASSSQIICSTCALDVRGAVAISSSVSAGNQPGVHAYRNASAQAIPDTTSTQMIFNASSWANQGMGWTSVSTATLAGYYSVTCGALWAANGTGIRQLAIASTGGGTMATVQETGNATAGNVQSVSQVVKLAAGDNVYCLAYQTSGGPLNINQSSQSLGVMLKMW